MPRSAILKGWLYLPCELVGDVGRLRERLTYVPRRTMDGERREPVSLYLDLPSRNMIGVPQAFGRSEFPGIPIDDMTSMGEDMGPIPRRPDPAHPSVKDPDGQRRFMADMVQRARDERFFIAEAPTGTGKTVVALNMAAELGRKTVVITHLSRLQDQWVQEAKDKLGLPAHRVGIVEGDRCEWEGKDVVVAMLQSLAMNPGRYGKPFYNSFGLVLSDEVHRVGAPVYSRVAYQFPSFYRVGMSATVDRKDAGSRVFYWHIGPVRVRSEQRALPMQVWPIWYDSGDYKLWGSTHGARVKCLSLDRLRNLRIVNLIRRMYDGGRNILVVADGIQHIQGLMAHCRQAGIPDADMGQFTNEVRYVEKRQVGDHVQPIAKKRKQSAKMLDKIKAQSRIIFATYGMIKEGIDIPRLDGGIDATPRSDAAQLIGRIRRPHDGKKEPVIWITMVDTRCDRSLRYFRSRLAEYQSSGAQVMNETT